DGVLDGGQAPLGEPANRCPAGCGLEGARLVVDVVVGHCPALSPRCPGAHHPPATHTLVVGTGDPSRRPGAVEKCPGRGRNRGAVPQLAASSCHNREVAPALPRTWLALPHLGETTQAGQPSSQRQVSSRSSVAADRKSTRL